MTDFYAQQTDAIHAAQRRGLTMFDTQFTDGEGWTFTHTSGPQAEWALAWASDVMVSRLKCSKPSNSKAFVVHVGERDGKPLLVVSCRPDEITADDNVPEEFLVAGQVPSLWLSEQAADKFGPRRGRASGDAATDARLNPELRAKSTFDGSPVKFVHGLCDDMHKDGLFDRKNAIARAMDAGITKNTATAQVYRWRKNNGM